MKNYFSFLLFFSLPIFCMDSLSNKQLSERLQANALSCHNYQKTLLARVAGALALEDKGMRREYMMGVYFNMLVSGIEKEQYPAVYRMVDENFKFKRLQVMPPAQRSNSKKNKKRSNGVQRVSTTQLSILFPEAYWVGVAQAAYSYHCSQGAQIQPEQSYCFMEFPSLEAPARVQSDQESDPKDYYECSDESDDSDTGR